MTDKEKDAIKFIKIELQNEKKERNDYQSLTGLYGNSEIEIVLNLIEKQDKMIELMLEELTDCEFEMKCSECSYECEKDYDSLYQCNKEYFEKKVSDDYK